MNIFLIIIVIVALVAAAAYIGVRIILPPRAEKAINQVVLKPPYQVPEDITAIHKKLFIADLHADPLLWNRDLLKKSDYGHIDLPRMSEGNLGFLIFGVVTKSPKGQNFESNSSDSDNITSLALIQGWPLAAVNSLFARAIFQARKLAKFSERSNGRLRIIKTGQDLRELAAARSQGSEVMGGLLGLEGVHALEGKLDNLDRLYESGFRLIGLTHFFDNEAAGSAHGMAKGGLTEFGRDLVRKIQEKRMIIDLAHSSPKVIDEVLEMAAGPVIVSHTGVKGTCDNVRNLSDEQLKRIADKGGLVGIAMFPGAVCGNTVEHTARAMRYAADLVGVDHVALGTDLDGAVTAPTDITGLPLLTEAMVNSGFTEEETGRVLGGNVLRVLQQILPGE